MLMPLEDPFTELGMGEWIFMGTAKFFLKIPALRFVPTLLNRKVFWRNLNTGCKIILKIKKPIEYQSMGKKQRLLQK
jgi:hypothetical protein